MKTTSSITPLRRLYAIIATMVMLTLIALSPAYIASMVLQDRFVEPIESTEQVTTIDVTDIDRNGTVMYTVSPSYTQPGFETESLMATLRGSDLIKVTVHDSDSSSYRVNNEASEECGLTLTLSSNDRYDADSKTFVGYVRVEDEGDETGSTRTDLIDCAIKFIEMD